MIFEFFFFSKYNTRRDRKSSQKSETKSKKTVFLFFLRNMISKEFWSESACKCSIQRSKFSPFFRFPYKIFNSLSKFFRLCALHRVLSLPHLIHFQKFLQHFVEEMMLYKMSTIWPETFPETLSVSSVSGSPCSGRNKKNVPIYDVRNFFVILGHFEFFDLVLYRSQKQLFKFSGFIFPLVAIGSDYKAWLRNHAETTFSMEAIATQIYPVKQASYSAWLACWRLLKKIFFFFFFFFFFHFFLEIVIIQLIITGSQMDAVYRLLDINELWISFSFFVVILNAVYWLLLLNQLSFSFYFFYLSNLLRYVCSLPSKHIENFCGH
jgi:hypothetical protein